MLLKKIFIWVFNFVFILVLIKGVPSKNTIDSNDILFNALVSHQNTHKCCKEHSNSKKNTCNHSCKDLCHLSVKLFVSHRSEYLRKEILFYKKTIHSKVIERIISVNLPIWIPPKIA